MSSYKTIKLESAAQIATVAFTCTQTQNAITPQFMDELGAVCTQLAQDAETRVVIFTATGRAFCAGLDMERLEQSVTALSRDEWRDLIQQWQSVFNALENLPQVTIAAINGLTLGSGIDLMLCCDFRISSTRALFGMPQAKLGLIPELGGITRLTRTVGVAWAKEIVLRSRNLSAMEASRVGLINRVADHGDLMGTTRKWAKQFAELPPSAAQRAKQLINTVFDYDIAQGLQMAQDAQLELLETEEFHTALQSARGEIGEEV